MMISDFYFLRVFFVEADEVITEKLRITMSSILIKIKFFKQLLIKT